jgi:two-component system phosphate regulon sensor histidine kinase PhoR
MWSSRLFWKLFLVTSGLNIALAIVFLIVFSRWQTSSVRQKVSDQLENTTIVLRHYVEGTFRDVGDRPLDAHSYVDVMERLREMDRETDLRFTVISKDGEVLADSRELPERMENHRERPELLEALNKGVGIDERVSATLGVPMLYAARPVYHNGVAEAWVRAAANLNEMESDITALTRYFLLLALVVGLAAISLTYLTVGRIIKPLANLTEAVDRLAGSDQAARIPVESNNEIGRLAENFNAMLQHRAQRLDELRDNSERLAAVLSGMAEGVIAVGKDERVLIANAASCRLLGLEVEDQTGRPLLEVTRSRPVYEAVMETLQTGRSVKEEFEVNTPAKRILVLRTTVLSPKTDPRVMVVLHDMTELRRLENLRQEFVANVSHELKTPLASIKAYAETLRLGAIRDPEHGPEFVENIEEQANRLHELIRDLIQLARVESGEETLDISSVDLNLIARSCVAHYEPIAASKNIELVVNAPAEEVKVIADADGLRSILDNLVENAIKYTPRDGCVEVAWVPDNSIVTLEVRDTGIGISAIHQDRVFERFYRVEKGRSRDMGGTGLGLSIVKHLAQSFGGSVSLVSREGEGSTFRVVLSAA